MATLLPTNQSLEGSTIATKESMVLLESTSRVTVLLLPGKKGPPLAMVRA